jgi:hypothetical protein
MLIAIYLCGSFDSYQKTYPDFKKYILDYFGTKNIFIFIHTDVLTLDKTTIINNLYKPTNAIYENYNNGSSSGHRWGESLINYDLVKYNIYAVKQSNIMRKQYEIDNNITFDIIIKLQPNVLLKKYLSIIEMTDAVNNNKLYYLNQSHNYKHIGCNIFYFGNPYYFDILDNHFHDNYDFIYHEFINKTSIHKKYKRIPEYLFYLFIVHELKAILSNLNDYKCDNNIGIIHNGWTIIVAPHQSD